jgi:hypothetical protein
VTVKVKPRLKYRFRGVLSELDPADWVEADVRLKGLRDRLARTHGPEQADAFVQRLLVGALDDFGSHILARKGQAVDTVMKLRHELSDSLADVLEGGAAAKKITPESLAKKFDDLEKALDELATPVDKLGQEKFAKPNTAAAKKEVTDALGGTAPAKKAPSLAGKVLTDLENRLAAKKFTFKNGAWIKRLDGGAHLELFVVDGKLRVKSFQNGKLLAEFGEFDVMLTPYKNRPRSSRVVQAHHGCQDAIMQQLFGKLGYDGGDAPTIWLRDSTGETPHGIVTHGFQNPKRDQRMADADYGKLRDWAKEELTAAGARPEHISAYLAGIDDYMRKNVFNNPKFLALSPLKKAELLGSFKL